MIRIINCLLVYFFSLCVLVAAQEEENVKLELLTLSLGERAGPFYYINNGKISMLDASPLGISSPFFYRGLRKLAFYDNKEHLILKGDGAPLAEPVAVVTLPKRENRALLIFSSKKEEKKISLKSYGIDTNGAKAGDYRIFNFSSQKVFVMMGDDKRVALGRGKEAVVFSSKWRREILDMPVKMGVSREGKFYTILSKVWGHRPERRKFVFIFDSGSDKRPIKVRTYFDLPNHRVIRDEE